MEHFPHLTPYGHYFPPQQFLYLNQSEVRAQNLQQERNNCQQQLTKLETAFAQIKAKYDQVLSQKTGLEAKLQKTLRTLEKTKKKKSSKRKVIRRKQDQLQKMHNCIYNNCKKEYASVLALNLHIKTKHNGGTKKQRDDLAKLIIQAELEGRKVPRPTISLPQGYVQKFKQRYFPLAVIQQQKEVEST